MRGHAIGFQPATSTFDRLVSLAAGRDPETLRYALRAPDRLHARLHRELFWAWLSLGLRRQAAQVQQWLESSGTSEIRALTHAYQWAASGAFFPPGAAARERRLFLSDLDLVTDLLLEGALSRLPDPPAGPQG